MFCNSKRETFDKPYRTTALISIILGSTKNDKTCSEHTHTHTNKALQCLDVLKEMWHLNLDCLYGNRSASSVLYRGLNILMKLRIKNLEVLEGYVKQNRAVLYSIWVNSKKSACTCNWHCEWGKAARQNDMCQCSLDGDFAPFSLTPTN